MTSNLPTINKIEIDNLNQIIGSLKALFRGAFGGAYNLIVLKVKSTRKDEVTMVTKEEFKEKLLALLDIINNR